MIETTILAHLQQMKTKLETTTYLQRLGALFNETVLLAIDEDDYILHFEKGRLVNIEHNPSLKASWRFSFRTDVDALNKFWAPMPKPGFHDIFGLVKIKRGSVDGDILCLVKNLRFFKEFMALGCVKDIK